MAELKRIGIITSGGDCGGLNAVIKGVAYMANSKDIDVRVIPNGYAGLYNLIEMEELVRLTPARLEAMMANAAGSEAGHSRVKISRIKDERKYERIKEGLARWEIDALVISGGDDTGSVMVDLHRHGIKCVHVPKTMDLDLQTYSVGADSTINRITMFCQDLRTTGRTHNRAIVVEVFGRYAGHTAFRGGIGADADCILIPEIPVDFDIVYEHYKETFTRRVRESDVKAGTYLIVVAEGLKDASGSEIVDKTVPPDSFGHYKLAGAGKYVVNELTARLKEDPEIREFMKETGQYVEGVYEIPEIRAVTPGHLVRCGRSSAFDVSFGMEAGASAVLLLMKGIHGVTVVEEKGNRISYMKTEEAIKQRHVDLDEVAIYEQMGKCFGRIPPEYDPEFVDVTGRPIHRHL